MRYLKNEEDDIPWYVNYGLLTAAIIVEIGGLYLYYLIGRFLYLLCTR